MRRWIVYFLAVMVVSAPSMVGAITDTDELAANDTIVSATNQLDPSDLEVIAPGGSPEIPVEAPDIVFNRDSGHVEESSGSKWLAFLTFLLVVIILCLLTLAVWYVKVLKQSSGMVNEAFRELSASKFNRDLAGRGPIVGKQSKPAVEKLTANKKDGDSTAVKATGGTLETKDLPHGKDDPMKIELPSLLTSKPNSRNASNETHPNALKPEKKTYSAHVDQSSSLPVDGAVRRSKPIEGTSQMMDKITQVRKAGNYQEALDMINLLDDSSMEKAETRLQKGVILEKLNMWDEAMVEYESAIRIQPDRPNGYLRKARLLERMQRFQEAQECYRMVSRELV